MSVKRFLTLAPASTVVEHSTHKPKVKGLNPTIGTGREKTVKKRIIIGFVNVVSNLIGWSLMTNNFWWISLFPE
jgi:hypothetical protein